MTEPEASAPPAKDAAPASPPIEASAAQSAEPRASESQVLPPVGRVLAEALR